MAECCGPSTPCCSGTPTDYDYGPSPWVDGAVDTFEGPIPRVMTTLTLADRLGTLRVRLNINRNDYRIRPGLYALGNPDDTCPVIVTANYKLTFDTVRTALAGRSLWLLVLDSRGVNVWCSAGKGVFSTAEVVRSVRSAHLEQVVSHRRLILPQLAATGVAAHEVRTQTRYAVTWGPVRIADLPAFLDAGLKATPEMRRVTFPFAERAKLTGVELSVLWGRKGAIGAVIVAAAVAACALWAPEALVPVVTIAACVALGVVAGALVAPVLLPWLPGRAFSAKGVVAGVLTLTPALAIPLGSNLAHGAQPPIWAWGALALGCALASFTAMNFTGSSTYTSPSGVEREMRRWIPLQLAGGLVGVVTFLIGLAVM